MAAIFGQFPANFRFSGALFQAKACLVSRLVPHVEGGVPCCRTLLQSVARGLLRAWSWKSLSNFTQSGSGLDLLFELFRVLLIFLGLMASMLTGLKLGLSGVTGHPVQFGKSKFVWSIWLYSVRLLLPLKMLGFHFPYLTLL